MVHTVEVEAPDVNAKEDAPTLIDQLRLLCSNAESFKEVVVSARKVLFAIEEIPGGYFVPKSVSREFNIMFRDLGLPTPFLMSAVNKHKKLARLGASTTSPEATTV